MPKYKLHPRSKKELSSHTLWLFKLLSIPNVEAGRQAEELRELFRVRFPKLKPQALSNSLQALRRVGVIRKARRFGQGEKDGAYRVTARGRYVASQLENKKTLDKNGNLN